MLDTLMPSVFILLLIFPLFLVSCFYSRRRLSSFLNFLSLLLSVPLSSFLPLFGSLLSIFNQISLRMNILFSLISLIPSLLFSHPITFDTKMFLHLHPLSFSSLRLSSCSLDSLLALDGNIIPHSFPGTVTLIVNVCVMERQTKRERQIPILWRKQNKNTPLVRKE